MDFKKERICVMRRKRNRILNLWGLETKMSGYEFVEL